MDKTERAYHAASGWCLDAMGALRRFDGSDAIDALRSAIRTIEEEQRRAKREDRIHWNAVAAPEPPPAPGA